MNDKEHTEGQQEGDVTVSSMALGLGIESGIDDAIYNEDPKSVGILLEAARILNRQGKLGDDDLQYIEYHAADNIV